MIEKEWCHFGHKFKDRCGHLSRDIVDDQSLKLKFQSAGRNVSQSLSAFLTRSSHISSSNSSTYLSQLATSETSTANNVAPKEVSPIFIQFLECLIQIMRKHPSKFQYTENLIDFLATHLYSCQFNNFLFNNPKEKSEFILKKDNIFHKIDDCSYSLWNHVSHNCNDFTNMEYPGSDENDVLDIDISQLYCWTAERLLDSGNGNHIYEVDPMNPNKVPTVKYASNPKGLIKSIEAIKIDDL